jgi:hypothetical protein
LNSILKETILLRRAREIPGVLVVQVSRRQERSDSANELSLIQRGAMTMTMMMMMMMTMMFPFLKIVQCEVPYLNHSSVRLMNKAGTVLLIYSELLQDSNGNPSARVISCPQ